MKASEAQSISKKHEIPLEEVYKQIKNNASHGNRSMTFLVYISNDKIAQLIADGYKISRFTDPIGMDVTKLEW